MCRKKADSSCDLEEFCDGVNHLCPKDTHLPDGTDCLVNGVGTPLIFTLDLLTKIAVTVVPAIQRNLMQCVCTAIDIVL